MTQERILQNQQINRESIKSHTLADNNTIDIKVLKKSNNN